MASLSEDLQLPKNSLTEFSQLTIRILNYLPAVITDTEVKNGYAISSQKMDGTIKYLRPINTSLFIENSSSFSTAFSDLLIILHKIKECTEVTITEEETINSVLYTIQQSIGVGLDLTVNANSARKHVGNRFEELMRATFSEIGIANSRLVLQIPYKIGGKTQKYKCENDLILSPYNKVNSINTSIDSNEIIVSVKTTSKDRLGKMFLDKVLLERFLKHPQKVIGIFHNDVQRSYNKTKKENGISFTLVSGLFMVYSQFIAEMDGVYYLDLPPAAQKASFSKYMKPFSRLLTCDIQKLLTP